MLSIRIEENLKPILEQIAEENGRSQGNLIEQWIKKDAKRLNIPIPPPKSKEEKK